MLRPAGDWLGRVEFTAGDTFRFDGAHITGCAARRRDGARPSSRRRSGAQAPTSSRADGDLRRHSMDAAEELRASDTFQERRAVEDTPEPATV